MFRLTASAIVLMILNLPFTAPVHATTCETDLAKFDFMSTSPTSFNIGEKHNVDRAYEKLRQALGSLEKYDRTQIFYSKGYDRLTQHYCENEKCKGTDILEGLQICSARAMSAADVCYPLAVVYKQKLYCLLYPGQTDFDPSKPFKPYIPFQN
jgi:hypothetical protein